MSHRNRYTGEMSVPHGRGRKQVLKGKRLGNKRVRRLPLEADVMTLMRMRKTVRIDREEKTFSK